MSIEIRRATESDIPELSRLVAALAAWEQALDPRVQFDWDGLRDAPNWPASNTRLTARSLDPSAISARLSWRRTSADAV